MSHVHPTQSAVETMAAGDPDEPVVMLNLLRFREVAESGSGVDGLSGSAAFDVYGREFSKLHPRFGGEPIWVGLGLHSLIGPEEWDRVLIVRYPTRRQFLAMLADPDYVRIAPIRAAALADSRLVETRQVFPRP